MYALVDVIYNRNKLNPVCDIRSKNSSKLHPSGGQVVARLLLDCDLRSSIPAVIV